MYLPEFVRTIGDEAAARLFNVSPHTARAYRLGVRRPRPDKAREIEAATGGRVRFAECFPEGRAA